MAIGTFFRSLVDNEVMGEQIIKAIQDLYSKTKLASPADDPHVILANTYHARIKVQKMGFKPPGARRLDARDPDIGLLALSETVIFACLPEGHNVRALAIKILMDERPDIALQHPKFEADFEMRMQPLIERFVDGGSLYSAYCQYNTQLQFGMFQPQMFAFLENGEFERQMRTGALPGQSGPIPSPAVDNQNAVEQPSTQTPTPIAETEPKMPRRHTADRKISQIERQLLEAEEAIFKLYGVPPRPPPPSGFTLALVPGIERSIRFRFAFACYIAATAKSAIGADAIPFIDSIFEAVTNSLEGYNVRVSVLFFESEPIETLTFSYSSFTRVNPELTGEVITNGLGAVQGLCAAFYQDFVSWLEMRLELGGGPMLMLSLTTGAATANVVDNMIVSQIASRFFSDDAQFDDSIQLCLNEAKTRHQYAEDAPANKTVSLSTNPTDPTYKSLPQPAPALDINAEPFDVPNSAQVAEDALTASLPDPIAQPSDLHANAKMVIEYSNAAKDAWGRIEGLPMEFQDEFLDRLDADTKCNAGELAEQLIQRHEKLLRPYDDDDANDALANARTISNEAQAEFMKVYDLLGDKLKPEALLGKIEAKFGSSKQTKERLCWETEARDAQEAWDARKAREVWEAWDARKARDARKEREASDARDVRDAREAQEAWEARVRKIILWIMFLGFIYILVAINWA